MTRLTEDSIHRIRSAVRVVAKDLDLDINVIEVAEEIAASFDRMLSGPFPKIGEDGKLLREELLAQFYNAGLGELITRYMVAEANLQTMVWSKETKVAFDNLNEAKEFLKGGIKIKINKKPNYNDVADLVRGLIIQEEFSWICLNEISGVITKIIPETSVLIG